MINIGKLVNFFDKGWVAYNLVGGWKCYRYSGIRPEMKCEKGMWICYKTLEADSFNRQREFQDFGKDLDFFTIEKPLVLPENSLIKVGYWEDLK